MADMLKLFHDRRLTATEPEHLQYIKGHLAQLKFESNEQYEDYSEYYGVSLEVKEVKKEVPKKTKKTKTS